MMETNRKESFKLKTLHRPAGAPAVPSYLTAAQAETVRRYHASFPMYQPTPLAKLPETAAMLGLGGVYVKDESKRFGLNAFKVLGGSWAIGCWLAQRLGISEQEATSAILADPANRAAVGDVTFITATDGNHGRGVAWTASWFGMPSVVYMPKGSAPERLNNIIAAGANARITDLNYDDTVRLARAHAQQNGWTLVQDTSWAGYEDIPARIMQGYGTMGVEAYEQLPEKPTHIFLQAGVGSMAGAVAGLFADLYGADRPTVVIVEPNSADCLYRTAEAEDGQLHFVTGDMPTIMAGLACGEPCELAWNVLRDCADHFISCPDYVAARGMRILGNPVGADDRIVSGESGASAFGCAAEIMTNPALDWMRQRLGLDATSRVLFFSTEGDTDRANYRAIVWDGKHPAQR